MTNESGRVILRSRLVKSEGLTKLRH